MRKRRFAALQDAYRKQPMAVQIALIGAGAALVAALIGGVATVAGDILSRSPAPSDSDLRLVSAEFVRAEADGTPWLEVMLRNPGDKVALLKRADFVVQRAKVLDTTETARGAVPPSASYEVVLPSDGLPQRVSVAIAQQIPPNEVDRFLFALYPDVRPGHRYGFWIDLALVYDEDDKALEKKELYFETGGE